MTLLLALRVFPFTVSAPLPTTCLAERCVLNVSKELPV